MDCALDSRDVLSALLSSKRPAFVKRENLIDPAVLAAISTVSAAANLGLLFVRLDVDSTSRRQVEHSYASLLGLGSHLGLDALPETLDMDRSLVRLVFVLLLENALLLFKFLISELAGMEEEEVTDERARKFSGVFRQSLELRKIKAQHESGGGGGGGGGANDDPISRAMKSLAGSEAQRVNQLMKTKVEAAVAPCFGGK